MLDASAVTSAIPGGRLLFRRPALPRNLEPFTQDEAIENGSSVGAKVQERRYSMQLSEALVQLLHIRRVRACVIALLPVSSFWSSTLLSVVIDTHWGYQTLMMTRLHGPGSGRANNEHVERAGKQYARQRGEGSKQILLDQKTREASVRTHALAADAGDGVPRVGEHHDQGEGRLYGEEDRECGLL